jgi:hypothetical protein
MEEKREDLKEVIQIPSTDGQVEKVEEPTVEVKEEVTETKVEEAKPDALTEAQEQIKKLEAERENYKKGLLKYKKLSLEPEEDKPEEVEEDYPEWDENSKKFQEQTLKQAKQVAESNTKKIVEDYNEKAAIKQFLSKHPEAEEKWSEVVSNYSPKNGKETIDSITKDLDRALFLTRYESGELSKVQEEAVKEGIKKGTAEAKVADLTTIDTVSSKSVPQGSSLSQGAINLATKMRVNTEKLAAEDESLTAEIKL